jgi:oligopeptidase B
MNRRQMIVSVAASATLAASSGPVLARQQSGVSMPQPPVARRDPHTITQLGRTRTDDYFWMKDDNWQAVMRDPSVLRADIREHLNAENAYSRAMLTSTEDLQNTLFEEMKGRIKEDDSSVPAPDGAWEYYVRYQIGAQHPLHARRRRGREDGEQILIDVDALAAPHDYYDVGGAEHSPDHALYAWAEDAQGSEYYVIKVKDLASGEVLPGPVESSTGDFTFSPDSQWLFWTFRDENGRPTKIYRRPARGGEDVLVYEETDPGMFIGVGVTASEKYISIGIQNQETSEYRLIPAADPTAEPRVVEPRRVGVRYDLTHWGDRFVVLTNADGAIDFKLMWAPEDDPSAANWTEWKPHRPGVFVMEAMAFENHLVRRERVNANTRLVITRKDDLSEHEIVQPEDAYVLGMQGGYEFDTATLRYVYTSPTTPTQTWDYDMVTRQKVLRKTQEIPSGHNPEDYVARRLFATAPDGEQVPVTILARRDTPIDGSAPLMVYGYGSYGYSMDPSFSIRNLSLVDRGWVWATAHIRGGTEKGWGWFLDGRTDKKINTFTDFNAVTDHLLAEGYGDPAKVVAYGGSAGGLLMGAIINLRPELYTGIIAAVPFVDVLNTMSDTTLPLTPPEWPEWGNPLEDEAAYDYIASYSPYDNVTAAPYPAVLATGGLSDPRVTYWEPAKWAAKLREFTTSGDPILLKINMEAGHGGASGRFDFLKEIAFDYAFALWSVERGWERT